MKLLKAVWNTAKYTLAVSLLNSNIIQNFRGKKEVDASTPQALCMNMVGVVLLMLPIGLFARQDKISPWILLPLIPAACLIISAMSMCFMKGWPKDDELRLLPDWRLLWRRIRLFGQQIRTTIFWAKVIKTLAKILAGAIVSWLFIGLATKIGVKDPGALFAAGLAGALLVWWLAPRISAKTQYLLK